MNHLDDGTIHAWLDGALSAEQSRGIEAHVAACATCSAAVAEARGLTFALPPVGVGEHGEQPLCDRAK